MNTCGQCKYAKHIKEDMRMRACMYGPPQMLAIPVQAVQGPNGMGMQLQNFRPVIPANDEAPSCFSPGLYGMDALQNQLQDNQTATDSN